MNAVAQPSQQVAISHGYSIMLTCYLSGQVSERQWQEHLNDEVFRAWIKRITYSRKP